MKKAPAELHAYAFQNNALGSAVHISCTKYIARREIFYSLKLFCNKRDLLLVFFTETNEAKTGFQNSQRLYDFMRIE